MAAGLYVTELQRSQIHRAFHKTHFQTSQHHPSVLETTHQSHFQPPKLEQNSQKLSKSAIFQANWSLGNEKREIKTELKERFLPFDLDNADLDKKKSMKCDENVFLSHFKLGYHPEEMQSSAKTAFKSYSQSHFSKSKVGELPKNRGITLGDEKCDFSTESKTGFPEKKPDNSESNKERMTAKRLNDHVSIRFGSNPRNTQTSTMTDYPWKTRTRRSMVKQGISVYLGGEGREFETSSHSFQCDGMGKKTEFLMEKMRDLRKSHFKLGDYKEQVSEDSVVSLPAAHPLNIVRGQPSSVHFGGFAGTWDSTSAVTHKPLPVPVYKSQGKTAITTSHVSLGSQPQVMKSTSHDEYPRHVGIEKNSGKTEFRGLELGKERSDYARVSESYGQGASHPSVSHNLTISEEARRHHFRLGFSPATYEPTSIQSKPSHVLRNSLDSRTISRLTGTNALIGHSEDRCFDSTYAKSFLWVQPEVDKNYSVSYK